MQFYLAFANGIELWLIVGVLVLLLFGGTKIPELMRGIGRGVGELHKGVAEGKEQIEQIKGEK